MPNIISNATRPKLRFFIWACALMHTHVPTWPYDIHFSLFNLSIQLLIINPPVFWTQLISQILPSSFPLRTFTAFPLHSHWASFSNAISTQLQSSSRVYNGSNCLFHKTLIHSACLLKQSLVWLHSTSKPSSPTSSQSTLSTLVWLISISNHLAKSHFSSYSHHGLCSGLNWVPQNTYVEVWTPNTSEYNLP